MPKHLQRHSFSLFSGSPLFAPPAMLSLCKNALQGIFLAPGRAGQAVKGRNPRPSKNGYAKAFAKAFMGTEKDVGPAKKLKPRYPKAKCENCGKLFVKKRFWAKYCSATCSWQAWDKRHPRQK